MRLHAVVEGSADQDAGGAPLVLLGSLGSTVEMWAPQRTELARTTRVITLDTRGHGGSPVLDGPYTVADLGADALETLDDLGIGRASFAGVSLGGAVAQWIAMEAPERVSTLALLCTSADFGGSDADAAAPWLDRAATVRDGGTGAVADAVVARWFSADYAAAEPRTVEHMRAMIADTPAEGYAACCEAIAAWDAVPRLGSIAAPTLVVAGAEDPATPPAHGRVLADAVPGARFELVEGAAHLASYQRPEIVTPLLRAHTEGHA